MSLCGLDFGTSNSTLAVEREGQAHMVPLEGQETTLPSALFFDFQTDDIHFGRQAIQHYTQGHFGRLMRSMKSILGSSQMDEGTQIKTRKYLFSEIIAFFIASLKERAEHFAQTPIHQVVLGRPVHFNDYHTHLDQEAENRLAAIAKSVGFTDISFQFEPIAAAYDYEQQCQQEELALIIDIGGGTSDFTIIRLGQHLSHKSDRQQDILANHGVHIGGTDFDRHFSLASVMDRFGMRVPYKDNPAMEMPKHFYVDLATWHRIHLLYEAKTLRDLTELKNRMMDKEPIDRLLSLLKQKDGHRLAGLIEQAKIDLSSQTKTTIDLEFLNRLEWVTDKTECPVDQRTLEQAIYQDVEKVLATIDETLIQAQIKPEQIQTIFTTGGSTALPMVQKQIRQRFSSTRQVQGDLFNSVGKGLLLEAQRRYR